MTKDVPTISFDFCKVKAKGSGAIGAEEEDAAQEGVQDDESGALLMVAVCSETGSLLGFAFEDKEPDEPHHPRAAGIHSDSRP